MKSFLLIFIFLFFSTTSQATPIAHDTSEHIYPGCPFNSTCSPEMGTLFLKYQQALHQNSLKNFFHKNGLPITGKRKKDKFQQTSKARLEAVWDSPCDYRENKKATFERVQTFAKNFSDNTIEYPHYVVIQKDKTVKKFKTSNDDSALGIYQNRLVFNRLIDDIYYQYQVDEKGNISIHPEQNFSILGRSIPCSQNALNKISNIYTPQEIAGVNCRLIYSPKGDQSYLFYLPRCE